MSNTTPEAPQQPAGPPPVSSESIMQALQDELSRTNGNRIWLLARNSELEAEIVATRAELESMRLEQAKTD